LQSAAAPAKDAAAKPSIAGKVGRGRPKKLDNGEPKPPKEVKTNPDGSKRGRGRPRKDGSPPVPKKKAAADATTTDAETK